ncbi:alpha/beta fold hydrolase [Uliginosibacterium sp. H1]|uniref:alpha/beta fold hydrolase n=1 Tax=Uliginosibacterium sp. H1 TaxID=3114757 RepID=UPI002E173E46|nr:alpha/beta fold hydrolase [Uliginosibacterium sp. H1]
MSSATPNTTPRPLVLFHGWGSRPGVFDALVSALDRPDALRPLLRAPAGTLADWADDIAPQVPEGAVVLGWSLGAMLALTLAARHPQRASRLALIAATPAFVARPDWPHALDAATVQGFRDSLLRDAARTQRRFIALQTMGDDNRHGVSATLEAHAADVGAEQASLANGLRLLATADLRRELPSPALPALLIHGQGDALMPAAASDWLAARWHASRVLRLDGCGHAPHLSRPQQVADAIREFIDA